MSVKTWFSNLWSNTKNAVAKFFEGPGGIMVRQALGTVVEQVGAIAMAMLLDAARAKVSQLNTSTLPNNARREEALDYLKGYAINQGIAVSDSLLRYTLETAVQAVKGERRL